jgi:hypothetical protein
MKIIELLDGSTWDLDTIKEKMHDDDFYYGNLSKTALSSTACKLLLTSPKTYHYVTKYGSPDTDSFAVGRLTHLMALEPHRVEEYEVIEVQSKNAKAWQEAKGKRNICTRKEFDEAQRIADALLRNEYAIDLIQGCEFEVPAIGMIGGLPFRAKADIYADGFLADLKTTTDLRAFPYSAKKYGYDVQAFIYTRLFGVPIDRFYFIAIDKASLDVGIYSVSPEFIQEGERKTMEAIETYKQFFILGEDLDSYTIFGEL